MRPNRRLRSLFTVLMGFTLMATVLAVSPSTASAADTVIDDFNDGDTSDWVFFGGTNAGGGGGPASDRPYEGAGYFSTGWGGKGTDSGFYGGAFRNFDNGAQVALPTDAWFNVWVYNQSNATVDDYTLEITIREDLDGNGWTNGSEDSFRYDTPFTATDFNDTWTLISAPVSAFVDQATGGNGVFDGALDEIVIVVAGVQGAVGSTVELDLDYFHFTDGPITGGDGVIDDFESGLPFGESANGELLGFYTFAGAGSGIGIATEATPPAPVLDDVGEPNSVLTMNVDATSFAGFIHAFTNPGVDTWVSQDWSTREGISFWFYGQNTGTDLFIDILDNRIRGSTSDDAERWTVPFVDDVVGWQLLEFPFADFTRKEIGNGAPNDGLGLFEMWGYAIGTLGTGGPQPGTSMRSTSTGWPSRRRWPPPCRSTTPSSPRARPAMCASSSTVRWASTTRPRCRSATGPNPPPPPPVSTTRRRAVPSPSSTVGRPSCPSRWRPWVTRSSRAMSGS